MKKISKGLFTEIFGGGDWVKTITTYIWSLPIYMLTEKSLIPDIFRKYGTIYNYHLDKIQLKNLIENYNRYCREYKNILGDEHFKNFIVKIKEIENNISKIRCVLEIQPKFTILKQKDKNGDMINYIVGRTTFFRDELKRDEITYYVGRLEDWGDDLNEIIKNPKFMEKSIKGLTKLMLDK